MANIQDPTANSQQPRKAAACRPCQLAPIKCLINAQRICAALMWLVQVDRMAVDTDRQMEMLKERAQGNLFKIFIKKPTK